jgi:hypothetical protein
MEQKAAPLKRRYCLKCGYDAETAESFCPQCRRRLRTTTETRISGLLQTFAGALLMGLMGYIAVWLVNIVREGQETGHSRFNGTPQQLMVIYAIVGFVLLFGVVSFFAGSWQLFTGKRNRRFVWVVAVMSLVLLLGAGYVIVYF